MGELTGEILRAFAEANGLETREGVDEDTWAAWVNKNQGKCPVGKDCPCDRCSGGLYKRKQYAAPELGNAVDALEMVKTKLTEIDGENAKEADDVIEASISIIENDIKQHGCPKCAEYMAGLQRKLNFLRNECKINGNSCREESDLTVDRIIKMQETFMASDEILREQTPETTENSVNAVEPSGYSDYHDCIQMSYHGLKQDGIPVDSRMCVAAKMCARDLSREDAIAVCAAKGGK